MSQRLATLEILHYLITVMIMTQPKRVRAIPIHCPGINASVYFLTLFGIIENVFHAAHINAECAGSGKYRMSEAFSLICCMWRNMPKHATLNHPLTLLVKKKIKNSTHVHASAHTYTRPRAPLGTILYTMGRRTYPY